jgi:hypothetical protein
MIIVAFQVNPIAGKPKRMTLGQAMPGRRANVTKPFWLHP